MTRQSGLLREMQLVANNIANISTNGFRREGLLFAEHVIALENGHPSLSVASATVRSTNQVQGSLTQTNNPFDFAIEGGGYFLIETPDGEHLSRAGSFTPNEAGELVNNDGFRLLDNGGAPIFIPPDVAGISVSGDGTVSAQGRPISQIGVFMPSEGAELTRQGGVRFSVRGGMEPAEGSTIVQGFLENSNVDAVSEIARMIEVQHAYELGQKLLDKEDERIRNVLQTLGR